MRVNFLAFFRNDDILFPLSLKHFLPKNVFKASEVPRHGLRFWRLSF